MTLSQIQNWGQCDRLLIVDLSPDGKALRGAVQVELWGPGQSFKDTAAAYGLWVDEAHRGVGIGTALLLEAERAAAELGHPAMSVMGVEGRASATRGWLESRGYARAEDTPHGLTLRKELR